MIRGSSRHTSHFVKSNVLLMMILLTVSTAFADERIKVIKERHHLVDLSYVAERDVSTKGFVDKSQIMQVKYSVNSYMYLVPVKIDEGERRGCYFYRYDKNLNLRERAVIAEVEELVSCEVVTSIFACNTGSLATSGVVAIYANRVGAANYWFEGTYFVVDRSGALKVDAARSELLTEIDTAEKARRKLKCL